MALTPGWRAARSVHFSHSMATPELCWNWTTALIVDELTPRQELRVDLDRLSHLADL